MKLKPVNHIILDKVWDWTWKQVDNRVQDQIMVQTGRHISNQVPPPAYDDLRFAVLTNETSN